MALLAIAVALSVAALAVRGAFALHPVIGWVSLVLLALACLAVAALWLIARPDPQIGRWW